MFKSAENARKKSTGQAAVRARLSGVRLDTEAEVNVMPK